MSLFRQTLRPPSSVSEDAVARYVAAIRAELEPDPLFERRLRGRVVNQYVALREGIGVAHPHRREMGKLGRAVLYASLTFAVSVTGVMAASQEALPGDALYPLKRQVERLRHEVLPPHLRDDLVAIELAERIHELDALTRSGRTDAIAGVVEAIEADYAALAVLDPDAADLLSARIAVLDVLVDRLPGPARDAVEAVIAGVDAAQESGGNPGGANNDGSNPNGTTNAGGASNDGTSGNAAPSAGTTRADASAEPTPRATRAPRPDPTPRPTKSPKPSN